MILDNSKLTGKRRGRGGDEVGPCSAGGDNGEAHARDARLSQRLRHGSKGGDCSKESVENGGGRVGRVDRRLSERLLRGGSSSHGAAGRFLVPLHEGMKVVAYFAGRMGCAGWYDATLASVDENAGEFVVEWDDGERKDTCKQTQHIAIGLKHLCKQGRGGGGGRS